jgi:hypothetical protein
MPRHLIFGETALMVYHRLVPVLVTLATVVAVGAGCAGPLRFPDKPLAAQETAAGLMQAYDADADGRADYFTVRDADGRIAGIGYDTKGEGTPTDFVGLDKVPLASCRHVILILDGIGYETVEAMRQEGRLRLFYPPGRVISTFPAMTDLVLADVFRCGVCAGYEAVHYDREKKGIVGGDSDYMSFKNEAWAKDIAYRAGALLDPLSYLYPGWAFETELGDFRKVLDRWNPSDVAAYFVSTAGLGTRQGLKGQRRVLEAVDRMAEELVWKTRGKVKVTVLSDHGHTLVQCERVDFRPYLRERGWRVVDRLEKPRDVAPIEYGTVTYASFATNDRAGLAATLAEHPGVDLAAYPEGDRVGVEKKGGRAWVERSGSRYRYTAAAGDPLELTPIIEKMKADKVIDADGFADDRVWFERTLEHKYPDALDRLWRAFNGLVENAPDVVASLKGAYCAGAASRAFWMPKVASTHGDLARKSSTAFIMSTIGPVLPPGVGARHRDLPAILENLTGRPWPLKGEGKDK